MAKEYNLKINGTDYNVLIGQAEATSMEVEVNGTLYVVEIDRPLKPTAKIHPPVAAPVNAVGAPVVSKPAAAGGAGVTVKSPLPGVILSVDVAVGETVKAGQKLVVLEAMKMENSIEATCDGKITAVKVVKGDSVLEGAELIIIG
ncbi:MAG: biotin/lipoyl-binding protein [Prevotellaceae bacterium]|jgi:biotin carboxyl carrier protein|nr:biotin/lipoyl-binding protein [Prevotellaceae bacterium]